MTLEEIEELLSREWKSKNEQIRALKKTRYQLLEKIHVQQQLLDRLDYLLYEIKGGK